MTFELKSQDTITLQEFVEAWLRERRLITDDHKIDHDETLVHGDSGVIRMLLRCSAPNDEIAIQVTVTVDDDRCVSVHDCSMSMLSTPIVELS